jgi:hypothetical protein
LIPVLYVCIATTPASAYKHPSGIHACMIKYVAAWTAGYKPVKKEMLATKCRKL